MPGHTKNARHYTCMQTVPLLHGKSNDVFTKTVLAACGFIVQRHCWPKSTSLECVQSIYVKTTGAACMREELFRYIEEDGQIVSLGIERLFCYFKHVNS